MKGGARVPAEPRRVATVDALRGLAALAVCIFHVTTATDPAFLPTSDALRAAGALGRHGVEAFFVISGFVIPLSLSNRRYGLASYGRFVARRVVRLDPTYVTVIALTLLLNWASSLAPSYRGEVFQFDVVQVLLHFGYVNTFFGFPWLNAVFWSLAIEFQYYLSIGLLFPLLAARSASLRWTTLGVLAATAFVLPDERFLFHFMPLFVTGILTYHHGVGLISRNAYFAGLGAGAVAAWAALGGIGAVVAIGTALCIAFARIEGRALAFLGTVSYSLYLVHTLVGSRVVNLSLRFDVPPEGKIGVVLLAVAASIGAAWLLWRCVERPSQAWSSAISYVPRGLPAEDGARASVGVEVGETGR